MTEHTSTSLHDLVIRTFAAVEAKDLEAMMSLFADDAIVIDPHFPTPQIVFGAPQKKVLEKVTFHTCTFWNEVEFDNEVGEFAGC